MNTLKIKKDYIPINIVDAVTAYRTDYRTCMITNNIIHFDGCHVEIKNVKHYVTQLITTHLDIIDNGKNFDKSALSKAAVKICPKFFINVKKFFKSQSYEMQQVHRKLYSVAYAPLKKSTDMGALRIILQLHYNEDSNTLYLTGFALNFNTEIIHSYNMRYLNANTIIQLSKTHTLISNKNVWWLKNWIPNNIASDQQKRDSIKNLPKSIRTMIYNEKKKLINNMITVQENNMQNILPDALKAASTNVAEAYRKIVTGISQSKTIYFDNKEVIDVSYSTSIKNRHLLVVFVSGSDTPFVVNQSDFKKFQVVEKVNLF